MPTNYNLHTLGWKAFQDLCLSIARDVWGQTVQGFCDSNDGGRDGAFHGQWVNQSAEAFTGSFLIQCKHTSNSQRSIKLSDLSEEKEKAKNLCAQGMADNYFLLTNYVVTGNAETKIASEFKKIPNLKHFKIYGREWITGTIKESKRLRMMAPRLYGLGDLSQILDKRAYEQAQEILSSLGEELHKFVITDSYKKSADALNEHGFVLLLGEPASGKSTIAAALALGALDQWGASTIKLPSTGLFTTHWNPGEKQFFWIDDVFGATQLDHSSTFSWNSIAPHLDAAIKKGAKIILTSRDYIFNQAISLIKLSAFPLLKNSQVIIEVEKLSKAEKEQILYNHIKMGRQSSDFKRKIKKHLPFIASHKRFKPETARRLGNPIFTENLVISEYSLGKFTENPAEFLEDTIRTLDGNCLSALALIFMSSGKFPATLDFDNEHRKVIEIIGGTLSGARSAFSTLNNSFLNEILDSGEWNWQYKHPTVRDAFGSYIMKDKGLLEILLKGMQIQTFVYETTCGDVGITGTKVIIPEKLYDIALDRIMEPSARRSINYYISYRCDKKFVEYLLSRYPCFFDDYIIYPHFEACSELRVISRLAEYDLLTEEKRQYFKSEISEIALSTPDAGFIRYADGLMNEDEIAELANALFKKLSSDFRSILSQWKSDCRLNNDKPSDFFEPLISTINDIKEFYPNDSAISSSLDKNLVKIDGTINEMDNDNDFEDEEGKISYAKDSPLAMNFDSRSIFDDVDQ